MSKSEHSWPTALVWAAITGSILVYGLVTVGSRELNLSLFDVLLPIAAVAAFCLNFVRSRVSIGTLIRTPEIMLCAIAIALVVLHFVLATLDVMTVGSAGLVRESLKTAGFFGQTILMIFLFRVFAPTLPSLNVVAGLIGLVLLVSIARHFHEIYGAGSWFLPRNLHLALYCTLLVVAYLILCSDASKMARYKVAGAHILGTVTAFVLFNKALVILLLVLLPLNWVRLSPRTVIVSFFTVGVIATLMLLALQQLGGLSFFVGAETIGQSYSVRIAMWQASIAAGLESFPWGIGLGQLPEILASVPEGSNSKSGIGDTVLKVYLPHNVFIAHFAEMGVLGLILGAVLVVLIVAACRRHPLRIGLTAGLLIFVPMVLQDALGLRAIPVLLAALFVYCDALTTQNETVDTA